MFRCFYCNEPATCSVAQDADTNYVTIWIYLCSAHATQQTQKEKQEEGKK